MSIDWTPIVLFILVSAILFALAIFRKKKARMKNGIIICLVAWFSYGIPKFGWYSMLAVPWVVIIAAYAVHVSLYVKRKISINSAPMVMGKIPFLGIGLWYYKDVNGHAKVLTDKYGDTVSVYMFGKWMTLLAGHEDMAHCIKQRPKKMNMLMALKDSFMPLMPQIPKGSPGVLNDGKQSFKKNDTGVTLIHSIKAWLKSKNMSDIVDSMAHSFKTEILPAIKDEIKENNGSVTKNVFHYMEDTIFHVTLRAIVGPVYDKNEEIQNKMINFFKDADPEKAFMNMKQAQAKIKESKANGGELPIYQDFFAFLKPIILERLKTYKETGQLETWVAIDSYVETLVKDKKVAALLQSNNQKDLDMFAHRVWRDCWGTMLAAVANTYASAAWMLIHLHKKGNEKMKETVLDEINEVFDSIEDPCTLEKLERLGKVKDLIMEVGRMYVPSQRRRNVRVPYKTSKGYDVPVGEDIAILVYQANHDVKLYKKPESFCPYMRREEIKNAGVLNSAFGSGAHPCTGRRFAETEIAMLFVFIIRNLEFKLSSTNLGMNRKQFTLICRPEEPIFGEFSLKQ